MVETLQAKEPQHQPGQIVVTGCIDFRTIEKLRGQLSQNYGLADGDYSLVTTAGSALNPKAEDLVPFPPKIKRLITFNHKDCGFAKQTGDDHSKRHYQEMSLLGRRLRRHNSEIRFHHHILPMADEDLKRHTCQGVAIINGRPSIVKEARRLLHHAGLDDNHDEIARAGNLTPDDRSLWADLAISLKLHAPKLLFIINNDETQTRILSEKAFQLARGLGHRIQITPIFVPTSS